MNDPVNDILNYLKDFKWISYPVVIILIIIGIANFANALQDICDFAKRITARFENRQLSDRDLKEQSLDLAKQLILLVNERQANDPLIDFQNWDKSWDEFTKNEKWYEYTKRLIRYNQETNNIYFRDYAPKVAKLREEFLKRGLIDKKLDMFYERPTNYIGLQIVAFRLAGLANKLSR